MDSMEVIGGKKCVICVGSTGAGKSTLIKKMTGAEVVTSSGADSQTTKTEVFKERRWIPLSEEEYYYWIDTQGWEDAGGEKDYYIFKNIWSEFSNTDVQRNHVSYKYAIVSKDARTRRAPPSK